MLSDTALREKYYHSIGPLRFPISVLYKVTVHELLGLLSHFVQFVCQPVFFISFR
jgi:hypothetical protein